MRSAAATGASVIAAQYRETHSHDLVYPKGGRGVLRVMEREELLRRWEQVEQEVSATLELITRHRNILAELGRKETDGDTIQIMLTQLENRLVFELQKRETLRAELARLSC